jgi:hypothetical protein
MAQSRARIELAEKCALRYGLAPMTVDISPLSGAFDFCRWCPEVKPHKSHRQDGTKNIVK